MKLSTKIQKLFDDIFKGKDYYKFLNLLSTYDNRFHTIVIKVDMEPMELIQKLRLISFLILSSIFKYKTDTFERIGEIETEFLVIRSYQDRKYQMNIILFKDSGIIQISILEI